MQFIIIVLGIIACSIGLVFLISGMKSSTKILENHQEEDKNDIFLKKYQEADSFRLIPTFGLIGLAASLGISYAAIEFIETKKDETNAPLNINDENILIIEIVQPEEFVTLSPPPPEVPELPPPPPPPTPKPPIIESIDDDIKDEEPINFTIDNTKFNDAPPTLQILTSELNTNFNLTSTVQLTPPTPPTPPVPDDDIIHDWVQFPPKYPGGFNALRNEVRRNYTMPRSFINSNQGGGTIHTRFVVLEDGSIGKVEIVKGIAGCDACNQESIEVIKSLKHKFEPGYQTGKPVKVWYTFPIKLEK